MGSQSKVLSAPSAPPPARGLLAPLGLAPVRCTAPPKPRVGEERTRRSRAGRVRRGAVDSACPPLRHSLRGCKTEGLRSADPGRPDPGRELGLPAPSTSLIPQCTPAASQPRRVTRRGPGTKTAEACGARCPGRAALGPPLPLAPSRLLSLPRRLQHPAADTRGRRKPEQGGTGQGRLGYDSGSPAPDLAGEPGRVHGRPQSTAPSSPALSAALSPDPRDCAELLQAVGERLLLGCWRQMVAAAAPRFADEGAMRRGRLRGSLVPGAARQEPSLSPTFRAGRTPAARPRRKISMKAGPGKSSGWLQDKVGGSSSTAKKTLPYRPGLFGKLPRRKWGAARVLPFPAGLAGGRSKYICLALPGTFVTLGGLVSMRKGGVFRELQNSWILPFKDECASAFYLLEMLF